MTARDQLKKIVGRESQGTWRQHELIGGKPASRKVTLTSTWVVQWLRLALSNAPNSVGVSHPSYEDGNRSGFRNIVFFRILDDGQSPKIH
jgi:hypothetical protein